MSDNVRCITGVISTLEFIPEFSPLSTEQDSHC